MAHFARVEDGTVIEVLVVDNKDCGGGDFPESEPIGQVFLQSLPDYDPDALWLQTSYSNSFRAWFAAPGMAYDVEGDAFHSGSPGPDWTLDRSTWQWVNSAGRRLPSY